MKLAAFKQAGHAIFGAVIAHGRKGIDLPKLPVADDSVAIIIDRIGRPEKAVNRIGLWTWQ